MSLVFLLNQQGTVFLLMLIGLLLKKKAIIDEHGRTCLTDLCVNAIIPCNIFRSFLIEFNKDVFRACGYTFLVALIMQLICLVLNKFIYNKYDPQQKNILQYSTIVSNGGFLGTAICEGIYGSIGVMYAAIFLIPMRVIMWSAGTGYFVSNEKTDKKKIIKNILTHPCLIAVYFGIIFMVTQWKLPSLISKTIQYVGSCNTAITMIIVGTILADVPFNTIINKTTVVFSVIRLVLLPALAWGIGVLFGLKDVALGASVLMTAMPAASTAAIFASRYNSDAKFATKLVVASVLISMITIPIWGVIV